MKNERLRFGIDIKSKSLTSISIGVNNTNFETYTIDAGNNTLIYDFTVKNGVDHTLQIKFEQQPINLKILDLRIHGCSVHDSIQQSKFNEKYGVLNIVQPGTWNYYFQTPIYEHPIWRIGLV